jgi:type I restriction-modification system DNA methylase subunit
MSRPDFYAKLTANKFDGSWNDEYRKISARYSQRGDHGHMKTFSELWGDVVSITRQSGQDILGQLYQDCISRGHHGQFFTPWNVVEMMVEMFLCDLDTTESKRILDPCCGSGRFMMVAGKKSSNFVLCGRDIDARCVRMTVINMHALGLQAEVMRGDSLTDRYDEFWQVGSDGTLFFQKMDESVPYKTIAQETREFKIEKKGQQTLF